MPDPLDKLMEEHYGDDPIDNPNIDAEEQERLAKEAADKKAEEDRLEEEEAIRLAKEAEENETEEEKAIRLAKEAEEEDEIILGDEEDEETEEEKAARLEREKEAVIPLNDETFLAYASEKLGREISSIEDISDTKTNTGFQSEQVKELDKFVKETGRPVEDWFNMQRLDIENMRSDQLIKTMLKIDYPMLSDSQIEKKYNSKYKLDKEAFTEDEVELGAIDLKIDEEKAKLTLTKMRDGYKVPVQQMEEDNKAEQLEKLLANKKVYTEKMIKSVDKIDMFAFEVDGQKVKYKPSKDDFDKIKDGNQNLETFFKKFKDEKGEFDFEALSLAIHFSDRKNVAKLIKAVKGRYVNEGTNKQIKKQKNTKLPKQSTGDDMETAKSKEDKAKLRDAVLGEMGYKKRITLKI